MILVSRIAWNPQKIMLVAHSRHILCEPEEIDEMTLIPMILVCKAKSGTPRHRRKATIAPLSTAQTKILFQQELHEGSKAGGFIRLETNTPAEIERKRAMLRRRYLRALGIKQTQGKRLIPRE